MTAEAVARRAYGSADIQGHTAAQGQVIRRLVLPGLASILTQWCVQPFVLLICDAS